MANFSLCHTSPPSSHHHMHSAATTAHGARALLHFCDELVESRRDTFTLRVLVIPSQESMHHSIQVNPPTLAWLHTRRRIFSIHPNHSLELIYTFLQFRQAPSVSFGGEKALSALCVVLLTDDLHARKIQSNAPCLQ